MSTADIPESGTTTRTKAYSYDELERLTEVSVPAAPIQDETYELDPEGNRLSSHLSDDHQTDDANRLTSDDNYTYVYDLNGNLISKLSITGGLDWAYGYDALDQLTEVTLGGNTVERYKYDAFGRRSLIETTNEEGGIDKIAIVNDRSDRAIDITQGQDGSAAPVRRYSHSANVDEPLQVETFNDGVYESVFNYHADHLGSIRYLTDAAGNIVNAYDYDSYGRPMFGVTEFDQPFAYTGREWDAATGLYHYRARAYDAETGRFLQEDPAGVVFENLNQVLQNIKTDIERGKIGNSGSYARLGSYPTHNINGYRYVENNPINFRDGSGQIPIIFSAEGAKKNALIVVTGVRTVFGALSKKATEIAVRIQIRANRLDPKTRDNLDCFANIAAGILDAPPIALSDVDLTDDLSTKVGKNCRALGAAINLFLKSIGG